MKKRSRSEVDLSKMGVSFDPNTCEDPKLVQKTLVTLLRFFHEKILPEIEAVESRLPTRNAILEASLRTSEDARRLLNSIIGAEEFEARIRTDIEAYLTTVLQYLSPNDAQYVQEIARRSGPEKRLRRISNIAATARGRVDALALNVGGSFRETPDIDDDISPEERAVSRAGENPEVPVYEL